MKKIIQFFIKLKKTLPLIRRDGLDIVLYDSLTKVYNRNYLKQMGKIEIARSKRYGRSFSLVFLDIDGLKA